MIKPKITRTYNKNKKSVEITVWLPCRDDSMWLDHRFIRIGEQLLKSDLSEKWGEYSDRFRYKTLTYDVFEYGDRLEPCIEMMIGSITTMLSSVVQANTDLSNLDSTKELNL